MDLFGRDHSTAKFIGISTMLGMTHIGTLPRSDDIP